MRKQNTVMSEQSNLKKIVTTRSLEYIKSILHNPKDCFNFEQMVWLNHHFIEIEKIYKNYGYTGLSMFYDTHSKEKISDGLSQTQGCSDAIVEFRQRLVLNEKVIGAYINNPRKYKLNTTFPNAKLILFNKASDSKNSDIQALFDYLVLKHISQIIGVSNKEDILITQKDIRKIRTKDNSPALLKKIYTNL